MSSPWMRKSTWAAVALVAFGAGAALVRLAPRKRAPAADDDVVSRASDSELEISPALASQRDGTLAVAWVAQAGGRDPACAAAGCGATGRYVGVRISAPGSAKLGPLVRFDAAPGARVSQPSIVALSDDPRAFLLVWLESNGEAPGIVYSARISPASASAPAVVVDHALAPRAAVTPGGVVLVAFAFDAGPNKGLALATSHDGRSFARHDVVSAAHVPDLPAVCGDDHTAIVAEVDEPRGVLAHRVPFDPEGPVTTAQVSTFGEHVARQAPTCFVSGADAWVVYGTTDRKPTDVEAEIVDALVFVRSSDGGRAFSTRATHRATTRLLHPAVLRRNGSFTVLAVMGAGRGDAHASASVLVLGADGRSQVGLTRTAVAPVKMVLGSDAAGSMGDTLGMTDAKGVVWTAVPDNASGESHVALVRVD